MTTIRIMDLSPKVSRWLQSHVAWRAANAAKHAVETHGIHAAEIAAAKESDRAYAQLSQKDKKVAALLLAVINNTARRKGK